jgi:large subunit ribosomal protein L29
MRNEEIRELSTKDIRERIDEEKLNLTRLKLAHAVSPLDNPTKIKEAKKELARFKTELRKRELKQESNG